MTTPAIEFREVTKVYSRLFRGQEIAALTNVSFEVAPADICAFLGPEWRGEDDQHQHDDGFLIRGLR